MIRWTDCTQRYQLSNSTIALNERDTVESGLLFPIWRRTRTDERYVQGSDDTITHGQRQSNQTFFWDGPAPIRPGEERSGHLPRQSAQLPTLLPPNNEGALVARSPVREAVHTGVVNSTGGAILGAWVSIFFCPPAWILFAAGGAGVVGGLSGAAQGRAVAESNDMRSFVERCNNFLEQAQQDGLTDNAVAILSDCARAAKGEERKTLIREIIAVCNECLGEESCRPLDGIVALMPIDPIPSSGGGGGGVRYDRDFRGVRDHSVAAATAVAFGGR